MTTFLRPGLEAVRPPTDKVVVRGIGVVEVVYRGGGREKTTQEGRCRLCLRPWRIRRPSRHHLVPKRWFALHGIVSTILRDCDANVIPLCRVCHDAVESPSDDQARRLLRKVLGSAEVALAIRLRGSRWFDERYPPSVLSAAAEGVQASRRRSEQRR